MLDQIQSGTKRLLQHLDITVMRYSSYKSSSADARTCDDFRFLDAMPRADASRILDNLPKSKSQYRQDLFVLSQLGWKRDGYFVDFGATNGVDISNSYLLEKEFGWSGIVAEPARLWHADLRKNRSCRIETDCVWHETGATLPFKEVSRPDLSTIEAFQDADVWRKARRHGHTYEVKSISLTDMLVRHAAPPVIDYLSVDTEGSELDILKAFDFDRFTVRIISVEHNFTPQRADLHALLTAKGFERRHPELSEYDDWYVLVSQA